MLGLLLLWGGISRLFQRSELVLGNGRLRWRPGVFGGWQEVEAGALQSIEVKKAGAIGSSLYVQLVIRRWGARAGPSLPDGCSASGPPRRRRNGFMSCSGTVRQAPDRETSIDLEAGNSEGVAKPLPHAL